MKKRFFISLLFAAALFSACRQSAPAPQTADSGALQNGDLIFVAIPMDYQLDSTDDMSGAIADATGTDTAVNYIHVAIVERDADSIWIIDATIAHGVDRHPFSLFLKDFTLKDGSLPQFDVMRLRDTTHIARYVEQAKTYVGRGYDLWFLPDNEEQYCSELVRNAYRDDSIYRFPEAPMNFKAPDGTFPLYWQQLFERLGQPIPQDVPGTNPNDMSKSDQLQRVEVTLPLSDK